MEWRYAIEPAGIALLRAAFAECPAPADVRCTCRPHGTLRHSAETLSQRGIIRGLRGTIAVVVAHRSRPRFAAPVQEVPG